MANIDYFATVEPYKGCVGGDYLTIINFDHYGIKQKIQQAKKSGNHNLATTLGKNLDSFGIAIGDVSGHMITDSLMVTYLDATFRALVDGEIERHGEVTAGILKKLNQLLYRHIKPEFLKKKPYTTLLYGEVHNDGRFRHISAGHPGPILFSNEHNRIEKLTEDHKKASTPLGVFPSNYHADTGHFGMRHAVDKVNVNELHLLMPGDMMILHTDGLTEQRGGDLSFADSRLEDVLREVKQEPAKGVHDAIKRELFAFCPPDDDLTIAVIKRK